MTRPTEFIQGKPFAYIFNIRKLKRKGKQFCGGCNSWLVGSRFSNGKQTCTECRRRMKVRYDRLNK